MNIGDHKLGPERPPFIISEIGCNHGGSYGRALDLIDAAVDCGADAVKFQCYTAQTITLDCDKPDFIIASGPWKGRRMYELYQKASTPWEWFVKLADHAKANGIAWFSSVLDTTSIDFLEILGCPAYKIPSFEIIDTPLIRHAAKTRKPIVISTGMADYAEIKAALAACHGTDGVAALHCVSGYPAPPAEANLQRMLKLKQFPNIQFGLSDHSKTTHIPVAATALGARVIEVHLKLDDTPTEDSAFSLLPKEFRAMTAAVRETWEALQYKEPTSEKSSRPLRRSIYATANIQAGEVFTERNVRSVRPGKGLPPSQLPNILGRKATKNIEFGEPITADCM